MIRSLFALVFFVGMIFAAPTFASTEPAQCGQVCELQNQLMDVMISDGNSFCWEQCLKSGATAQMCRVRCGIAPPPNGRQECLRQCRAEGRSASECQAYCN